MKNLFLLSFLLLPFFAVGQTGNCQADLISLEILFENCEEAKQNYQDILIDGITNEEVLEYADEVFSNNEDLILENAEYAANNELLRQKLDSLINEMLNGTVILNQVKLKGNIKPPND